MITVKINENTLLDMLMDRVEFWSNVSAENELFRKYYQELIEGGGFDGCELDINYIVDNDYINNTAVILKKEFENFGIKDEEDGRILERDEENNLYLIQTY